MYGNKTMRYVNEYFNIIAEHYWTTYNKVKQIATVS